MIGLEYEIVTLAGHIHSLYGTVILYVNDLKLLIAKSTVLSGDEKLNLEGLTVYGNSRAALGKVNIISYKNLAVLASNLIDRLNVGGSTALKEVVLVKTAYRLDLNNNIAALGDLEAILLVTCDGEGRGESTGILVVICILSLNGESSGYGVSADKDNTIALVSNVKHCKHVTVTYDSNAMCRTVVVGSSVIKPYTRYVNSRLSDRPLARRCTAYDSIVTCGSKSRARAIRACVNLSVIYIRCSNARGKIECDTLLCSRIGKRSCVAPGKSRRIKLKRSDAPIKRGNGSKCNVVCCAVCSNKANGGGVAANVCLAVACVHRGKLYRTVLNLYTLSFTAEYEGAGISPGNAGYINVLRVNLPFKSRSTGESCYGVLILVLVLYLCRDDLSNVGSCIGPLVTLENEVKLINVVATEFNLNLLAGVNGDDVGILGIDAAPLEGREVDDLLARAVAISSAGISGNRNDKANRKHYND